jgi:hypothetical protein
MSLSVGIFFSLLIVGLAQTLPTTLANGLKEHGVPTSVAHHVAALPPVSTVFSAFLGVNPIRHLLQPSGVLQTLPPQSASTLTGKRFFPELISAPFHHGLVIVFAIAALMGLIGAGASAASARRDLANSRRSP